MATAPKISNLPAAPNRQQPANFAAKGDALLSSLQGFATEANALGDYVEGAAGQIAIDKAAVDVNVPLMSDAKAAAPLALGYRDTAKAHKDSAAASEAKALQHKNDVASAVVYQDLASIALSKNLTMIDGSIDTSPNPSLAVQRRTSWYNETLGTATRGTRREMPARKVVIAEAHKVTIYDGDDPSMPMWMVFNKVSGTSWSRIGYTSAPVTSVFFKNGKMGVGSSGELGSLIETDFYSDAPPTIRLSVNSGTTSGGIAQRNEYFVFRVVPAVRSIIHRSVAGVVLDVLDSAPVDPISGLQIPTVWAFTVGGVTQLGWDGEKDSVWNLTHSDTPSTLGGDAHGDGTFTYDANGFLHRRPVLKSDKVLSVRYAKQTDDVVFVPYISGPPHTAYSNPTAHVPYGGSHIGRSGDLISSGLGLTYIKPNYLDAVRSLYANITAFYNTGMLNSKCNGVYLSSTDASVLSERKIRSDFTGTGNLDGWMLDPSATNMNGTDVLLARSATGNNVLATFSVTGLEVGRAYSVDFQRVPGYQISALIIAGYSSGFQVTDNKQRINFVATQATHQLAFYSSGSAQIAGLQYVEINRNDEDRSNFLTGLSVVGTIQRTPVADGAELVGYTGFSPTNRFVRFAGDEFAYGTGDFHVCGWVKFDTLNSFGALIHVTNTAGPNDEGTVLSIYSGSTDTYVRAKTKSLRLTTAHTPTVWRKFDAMRRNGVLFAFVDGALVGSTACPDDLTDAESSVYVGPYRIADAGFNAAPWMHLALLRNTKGSAPSPEQIADAYREELPMFQPKSKVTMKGTSSAVSAVYHDRDAGLSYVGTSDGRSDFSGLVRVGGADTPITTKIVARDGMILEQ